MITLVSSPEVVTLTLTERIEQQFDTQHAVVALPRTGHSLEVTWVSFRGEASAPKFDAPGMPGVVLEALVAFIQRYERVRYHEDLAELRAAYPL